MQNETTWLSLQVFIPINLLEVQSFLLERGNVVILEKPPNYHQYSMSTSSLDGMRRGPEPFALDNVPFQSNWMSCETLWGASNAAGLNVLDTDGLLGQALNLTSRPANSACAEIHTEALQSRLCRFAYPGILFCGLVSWIRLSPAAQSTYSSSYIVLLQPLKQEVNPSSSLITWLETGLLVHRIHSPLAIHFSRNS